MVLKNGIFVAGHPRSGTSLACRLLESAGVTFPSDTPGDGYNRDGYFELLSAKELEKELIEKAMNSRAVSGLNQVVRRLNQVQGLAGLKIVHIPALFFYRHIAKNIRTVFIYRHPADVRASMLRRGISDFKLSWFDNCNALIAAHENISKSIVISYERVLKRPDSVAAVFRKIGLTVDPKVIRRDYRTQASSGIRLTGDEIRLYRYLQKLEKRSLRGKGGIQ